MDLDLANLQAELNEQTITLTSTLWQKGATAAGAGPSEPDAGPDTGSTQTAGGAWSPVDPVIAPSPPSLHTARGPSSGHRAAAVDLLQYARQYGVLGTQPLPPAAPDPRRDAAWADIAERFAGVFAEPPSLPPGGPDTNGRCTLQPALQDWHQAIRRRRTAVQQSDSSAPAEESLPLARARDSDLADLDDDAYSRASTDPPEWGECTLATLPSERLQCSAGPRKEGPVTNQDRPPCGPGGSADWDTLGDILA